MSENRDYYEVLGVDKDADARTIKRAFLKKARTVHPDVSDDPEAEAKFKELNEAYSVLSDEQKRANYDRYGTADGPGGSGYVDINDIFGGMGMDDLFSSFFGGGAGGGARSRRERRRGRDMAISLSVTLEEAALGCKKTIGYDRLAPCEDCNGTGKADGATEKQCSRCHGTGYVTTVQRSFWARSSPLRLAPTATARARSSIIPARPVTARAARLRMKRSTSIFPPAFRPVASCVSGFGEAGLRGEPSGDLIVNVRVADHERFKRNGDDLYLVSDISIAQAALGCEIEVEGIMPDEVVKVTVPAGAQYGDTVSVNNYGMPRIGGGGSRGRLIVQLRVVVPTNLSNKQRELLRAFADEMGDDVASGKKSVTDRIKSALDDILD